MRCIAFGSRLKCSIHSDLTSRLKITGHWSYRHMPQWGLTTLIPVQYYQIAVGVWMCAFLSRASSRAANLLPHDQTLSCLVVWSLWRQPIRRVSHGGAWGALSKPTSGIEMVQARPGHFDPISVLGLPSNWSAFACLKFSTPAKGKIPIPEGNDAPWD